MKKPIMKAKFEYSENDVKVVFEDVDNHYVDLNSVKKFNERDFKGYDRIFLVGPQRSGTTFASKAISHTLGEKYRFVDEDEYYVSDIKKFEEVIQEKYIVVQAPAMTHVIDFYANDNDLVVFMTRKWSDIVKSIYRKNGKISNYVLAQVVVHI